MKTSFIITTVIVILVVFYGVSQRQNIDKLAQQKALLEHSASSEEPSTNPATLSTRDPKSQTADRPENNQEFDNFVSELFAFAKKMDSPDPGDQENLDQKVATFLQKIMNLEPLESRALLMRLANDRSLNERTRRELGAMTLGGFSAKAPGTALAFVTDLTEDSPILTLLGRRPFQNILLQWVNQDPDQAVDWLMENQGLLGDQANEIKLNLLEAVIPSDLEMAFDLIQKFGFTDKNLAFLRLGSGVSSDNLEMFSESLRSLTPKQREHAVTNMANSPLFQDFEKAAQWLEGKDLSQTEKEAAVSFLYYNAQGASSEKWLGWINQQPLSTSAHRETTERLLSGWTKADYVAAGEWLKKVEDGPKKEISVQVYAETLSPFEPAAAADWATSLPEGQNRSKLLKTIYREMKKSDPTAAASFAEEHQILEQ